MKRIPVRQLAAKKRGLPSDELFKIRRVEDILGGKDMLHNLHRHDFYFVLALMKGSGKHEIDFTPYKVLDNSLFFLRPGQVHELHLKADSSGYLLEFNREFYQANDKLSNQRITKASNKNYCQFEPTRFRKIKAILDSIFNEFTNREEGYREVIKSSLEIFFIELVRQSPEPSSNGKKNNSYTQERFEEFLGLLDQHITIHKQASHYGDAMNLSLYQLNEITKASVGKTASQLINEQIVLEAKRYLVATTNQVKDIAGLLGYDDPSYFIRFFKKHMGVSPEAFRHSFK